MQSWGMWLPTNCLNTTEYSEAALSLMRTHVVRGTTLAQVAREIDIGACLLVGVGERKSGGRDRPHGALIAKVFDDTPAQAGGLREGDIITQFNGRSIERSSELPQ